MQLTMKSVKQSDGSLVFIVATDSPAFFKTLVKRLPKVVARLAKQKDAPADETFGEIKMPEIKTRKASESEPSKKATKK